MYRRPKFLEVLHEIREEMSREVDYDMDLFAEMLRSGKRPRYGRVHIIRGVATAAPMFDGENDNLNDRDAKLL
jgi:hypothetical protein